MTEHLVYEEQIGDCLIGQKVTGVEFTGTDMPTIVFDRGSLFVASSWRATRGETILSGADSKEESKAQLRESLIGLVVDRVRVESRFHDLELKFEGEVALETFADTELYESWHFRAIDGRMFVGGPGHRFSYFA